MSLILNLRYGIPNPFTIKYHTVSLKSTGMGATSKAGVGGRTSLYSPQENGCFYEKISHDGPVTRWLNRRRRRWPDQRVTGQGATFGFGARGGEGFGRFY